MAFKITPKLRPAAVQKNQVRLDISQLQRREKERRLR